MCAAVGITSRAGSARCALPYFKRIHVYVCAAEAAGLQNLANPKPPPRTPARGLIGPKLEGDTPYALPPPRINPPPPTHMPCIYFVEYSFVAHPFPGRSCINEAPRLVHPCCRTPGLRFALRWLGGRFPSGAQTLPPPLQVWPGEVRRYVSVPG